jgi:hypothetical protein
MNKRRALTALLLVAGVVVVVGGGLMASNMGFKLNRALKNAEPGVSASGLNTLGLPYNRQVGIDLASDLFGDMTAAAGDFTTVQFIARFLEASDTFQAYTFSSPDFNLAQGEGYVAKLGTNDLNYIVVGSHDPGAVISLDQPGPGSASGLNFIAPPYHSTASMASELFQELNFLNVQFLARFLPQFDTFQTYALASPDWPIVPGEAYLAKMQNTVAWMPSHF